MYYDIIAILLNTALILLIAIASVTLILVIRMIYGVKYISNKDTATLEIVPPANQDKSPEATSQLIHGIFSLLNNRPFHEKIIGRKEVCSLEIHSNRDGGIRYIISCNTEHIPNMERLVASYLTEAKLRKVDDQLKSIDTKKAKVFEYSQKGHFAYPMKSFGMLESHDPISYITNSMTKLKDNEFMAYQLVLRPTKSRESDRLINKIMINDNLALDLGSKTAPPLSWFSRLINSLLFGAINLASETYHGSNKEVYRAQHKELEYEKQVAKGVKPARTLTYFEHELVESINNKLRQPLFKVDIRLLIKVDSAKDLVNRRKSFDSALDLFTVPKYQALKLRYIKHHLLGRSGGSSFLYRMPSFSRSHNSTLSVSEIADLYHFPNTMSARTENVVKSLSRVLPAPISLKSPVKPDLLIGENAYQGSITPIGLTNAERERHLYIIGGTGNGKTTMLLYSIIQDIKNDKGVAVIDPHGDLAENILRHIPKERIKDVIYMNPDDLSHPIGMNLLELTPGLSGDDLLREKDIITESTVSVLRKIFSDNDSGGHRVEYVLRNSIQTALTIENATLFTIFELLNNAKFRRSVTKNLEDKNLRDFWKNELGKAGEFQRVKMAAGITSKIGRFLFSASARVVLEQPRSTVDFNNILDDGKILICNFSKGLLGDDTSALFGTTVLAKLQTASLRRARVNVDDRRPFYLYVDEFQNFATMPFVQMLSEARKYKLFLTMAEQSTSQQDQQRLVDIILANVGTVVCFRSGSPADERMLLPLFSPFIEPGEIANLPSFNFYARIAAVHSQEPMSGATVLLDDNGSEKIAKEVITSSRKLYAKSPKEPKSANNLTKLGAKPGTKKINQSVINAHKELMNTMNNS